MGRYVNPEPPEYDTLVFIMWLLWSSTKWLILSLFLSSTGKAMARFPRAINPNPDFVSLSEKVTYCQLHEGRHKHFVCGSFIGDFSL